MAKERASLLIRIGASISDLENTLKQVQAKFDRLGSNLRSTGAAMTKFVTLPVLAAGAASLKAAGDMEQAQVAFEVMLGSAEKAGKVVKDLYSFAAKTPFEFDGIQQAARLLLNAGVATDQLNGMLRTLGDVAAGTGQPIQEIALIYQQVANKGKAANEELMQLAERGVPIYEALANTMGKSKAEVQKLAEQGKVGIGNLNAAFRSLTDAGGRYHNMMARQGDTLLGKWSTFKDNFKAVFVAIGEGLQQAFDVKGILTTVSDGLGKLAENIKVFAREHPALFKLAASLVLIGAAIGPIAVGLGGLLGTLAALKVAFATLGITMKAALIGSGIGLIVVALGAAALIVWQNWEKVSAFFAKFWAEIKVGFAQVAAGILVAMLPVVSLFSKDLANSIRDRIQDLQQMAKEARNTISVMNGGGLAGRTNRFTREMIAGDIAAGLGQKPAGAPYREQPRSPFQVIAPAPLPTRATGQDAGGALGQLEGAAKVMADLQTEMRKIEGLSHVFLTPLDAAQEKADALKSAIGKLLEEGLAPDDARIVKLKAQYDKLYSYIEGRTVDVGQKVEAAALKMLPGVATRTNALGQKDMLTKLQELPADFGKKMAAPINSVNTGLVKMNLLLGQMRVIVQEGVAYAMDGLAEAFSRAFANVLTGVESLKDAVKSLGLAVRDVLRDLIAAIAKAAIIKGISSALGLGSNTSAADFGAALIGGLLKGGIGKGQTNLSAARPMSLGLTGTVIEIRTENSAIVHAVRLELADERRSGLTGAL